MSTIGKRSGGSTRPISLLPHCPRARAPEVVAPHEAALQQVRPELRDVGVAELGGAGVFDVDERAVEEIVVAAAAHDEIFGIAFAVDADGGLRELGESNAEVDVGAGIVGAPALAAGFAVGARVHQTAEVKLAVLEGASSEAGRLAAPAPPHVAARPDLRVRRSLRAAEMTRTAAPGTGPVPTSIARESER